MLSKVASTNHVEILQTSNSLNTMMSSNYSHEIACIKDLVKFMTFYDFSSMAKFITFHQCNSIILYFNHMNT